jgi:hypothetical protein
MNREDREALKDATSREDKAKRRKALVCSCCKPHAGENARRKPKHQSKPKGNR